MNKFAMYEYNLENNQGLEITLNKQANVHLLTPTEFNNYKNGKPFYKLAGGLQQRSPAILVPPHPGHYIVTIDMIGFIGDVTYNVKVINL